MVAFADKAGSIDSSVARIAGSCKPCRYVAAAAVQSMNVAAAGSG